MPVLNTINAKIALAKGWKVDIFPAINLLTGERITKEGKPVQQCFWSNGTTVGLTTHMEFRTNS